MGSLKSTAADTTPLNEIIRNDLETLRYIDTQSIDLRLRNLESLTAFYRTNNFNSVWIGKGRLRPRAVRFLTELRDAENHGLPLENYLYDQLLELVPGEGVPDEETSIPGGDRSELEFLLTEALFRAARDFSHGLIDPSRHLENVQFHRDEMDFVPYFLGHLENDRLVESLFELLPQHRHYRRLVESYRKYRRLMEENRGWPRIPSGPTLKVGMSSDLVRILKQRLWYEDYWNLVRGKSRMAYNEFDTDLMEAVKKYQRDRDLTADGEVGNQTREALNVSVYERLRQIRLNLERWRWLPRQLGSRYVWVNIADYDLKVVEDSTPVFSSRAIVGRSYRQTPVFGDRISYIVFNPSWTIPPTVVKEDLLPEVKKDPDYLRRRNVKLYSGWGSGSAEVDPASVDWNSVVSDRVPYRFVQQPGPENSLGKMKFMFPNKFDVYLHDTPYKDLFQVPQRDFSSGCIRVEDARGLAVAITGLSDEAIGRFLKRERDGAYHLKPKVPIYILYLTSWISEDGRLQFRKDIYDRDQRLADVLLDSDETN